MRFDSSRVGYRLVLGFRLYVRCRFVAVWWMANKWNVCFIIAFHNFARLENWLTYQCPSSEPVVITMKKKLAGTWNFLIGCWPVQMNGNKFATGEIVGKPVEVVKGRILAGWAQKSPKPWVVLLHWSSQLDIHGGHMVVVGGLDWVWKPSNWLWALVSFPYLPALWHSCKKHVTSKIMRKTWTFHTSSIQKSIKQNDRWQSYDCSMRVAALAFQFLR